MTPRISPSRRVRAVEMRACWQRFPAWSMAGRLMGSVDGRSSRSPRGDPDHHPQQPEMLRALRDPQGAKLVNKFILSPTPRPKDGGRLSPERAVIGRGSRTRSFLRKHLKPTLKTLPSVEQIIFPREAGTQAERMSGLSDWRPSWRDVGCETSKRRGERAAGKPSAHRGGREFPEPAGLMENYLAEAQGEDEAVAHACRGSLTQPRPRLCFPADPVSVTVALADKNPIRWVAFGIE